jgi:CRP-like cAMP-binding protein
VPRTASVSAVGAVTVLALDRDEFLAGVAGHPRSTDAAQRIVAQRLDGDFVSRA